MQTTSTMDDLPKVEDLVKDNDRDDSELEDDIDLTEDEKAMDLSHVHLKRGIGSSTKFTMPSFIRVFVINRILKKNKTQLNEIRKLILHITPKLYQKQAEIFLYNLIKYGIKKYMKKYFNVNLDLHVNIIEKVFNQIVLNKFVNDYQQLITYKHNEDNNKQCHFQSKLFNMNDLMCKIFQYLEYNFSNKLYVRYDLYYCSFICSHWLYHSCKSSNLAKNSECTICSTSCIIEKYISIKFIIV